MALDTRWKNPPGPDPQQLYSWAQDLIGELRKGRSVPGSDVEAQAAVGGILVDSTTIDFTYDDATPSITAAVKAGSIEATHIATGAVGADEIASGAVGADEIASGAVGPDELAATAVTPGSYTSTNLTVDADGRITAAASGVTAGMVLLTSGVCSSQATLDLVLTGYTGYRGIVLQIANFVPVTDATDLWLQTSTDGGSSYDAGAGDYAWSSALSFTTAVGVAGNASDTKIVLNRNDTGSQHVSNVAAEGGISTTLLLANQTATAHRTGIQILGGVYASNGAGQAFIIGGGGVRLTAADVDAVRFLFSSGNIASGNYAVYGLA